MPTSPLAPGKKLDRYELVCPIGEGGMAIVWIARQTGKFGFQKLVAVKTILPRFAADPRFQRMFIDEARIASRIDHLNVAQILDVGEQDDISYLVMEHVEGESLQRMQRAARKKGMHIPPGVLLRVMADVCAGLHAAHELCDEQGQPRGVIHRDVSPQNVLVSTKGVAKLIDFGIAKARDRLSGDTTTDQVKGKLRYMAPEQAVGQTMDRRADVWAVGAVLYHLLAGRPPFEGEHDVAVLAALTSGRPPEPLPPGVHPSIAAVVMRALTPAPDGRFDTAASMQQALEEAMVAAGVGTSTGDVATFLAQVSGEDAEKRREAIRRGLEAANAWAGASDDRPRVLLDPPSSGGRTLGSAALTIVPADRRRTLGTALAIASAGVLVGVVGLFVASSKSQVATASASVAASVGPPSVSAPAASAPSPVDTEAPPPAPSPAAAPPAITRPTGSVHRPPRPLPATAPARPPSPGGKTGDGRVNDGF
jgi:eukaryotic-like serine/threonine-protein kinase